MVFCSRKRSSNITLAPKTHYFFYQIDFAGKVEACGRHRYVEHTAINRVSAATSTIVYHAAAQPGQTLTHKGARNISASKCAHALRTKINNTRRFERWIYIHQATGHLSPGTFLKQCAGNLRRNIAARRVYLTLIANGSFGNKVEITRSARNVTSIKRCRFEQHVAGILINFGILRAHNACQAHSTLITIRNNNHVACKRAFGFIKQGELFAVARRTHNNVALAIIAAANLRQIKRMKRMAGKVQHVICNVYHVVNGARTCSNKTTTQPLRARRYSNIANNARGIT